LAATRTSGDTHEDSCTQYFNACLPGHRWFVLQAPTGKAAPAEVLKIDFATLDKDANGNLSKQEVQPVATWKVYLTLSTQTTTDWFPPWNSRAGTGREIDSTPVIRRPLPAEAPGAAHAKGQLKGPAFLPAFSFQY
jgi:hypothetical protein